MGLRVTCHLTTDVADLQGQGSILQKKNPSRQGRLSNGCTPASEKRFRTVIELPGVNSRTQQHLQPGWHGREP
jgi:hypothetical protein